MPFVPVANTLEAELRFTYDTQNIENTLYFLFETPPVSSDLQDAGELLSAWWIANMAGLLSASLVLREIFLTDLTSATGPTWSTTLDLPAAATIGEEGMPGNCSPCISFHTGNRGRSFRGRNYLAGIPVNQVATSTFEETWANNVVDAYLQMKSDLGGADFTHVVVSRFSGVELIAGKKHSIPRVAGIATPVDSYSFTDRTIDSQRKRLPNH